MFVWFENNVRIGGIDLHKYWDGVVDHSCGVVVTTL